MTDYIHVRALRKSLETYFGCGPNPVPGSDYTLCKSQGHRSALFRFPENGCEIAHEVAMHVYDSGLVIPAHEEYPHA